MTHTHTHTHTEKLVLRLKKTEPSEHHTRNKRSCIFPAISKCPAPILQPGNTVQVMITPILGNLLHPHSHKIEHLSLEPLCARWCKQIVQEKCTIPLSTQGSPKDRA